MTVRTGVYARISSDRDGVQRQSADCEGLAQRKGWLAAEQYVDDDVSAWSGRTQPEYARALSDLTAGLIDGLLAANLDDTPRVEISYIGG